MKLVELKAREYGDPFSCVGGETHTLVTTDIDIDSTLCERFKDTRTPYEQYCAGEKYLKYNDETLYSRAAHEHMFDERRVTWYPIRNIKI